jgi:hypothetical protein
VSGACSCAYVCSARSRNPPNNASKLVTNSCTSRSTCAPRIRLIAEVNRPNDALSTRADIRPAPRAGAAKTRMSRPSRNEPRRLGASRKSRAEREGGVSTMIRSQCSPSLRLLQLAQLLHRHVLLRAGEGTRQRLVERVLQDRLRRARVRRAPRRSRRRSVSCPASWRSGGRLRCPGTAAGCCPVRSAPCDWASRRAGSMVRTHTVRPRWAARRARAAAVVVLPTPPEPQHTITPTARSSIRASTSRWRSCGSPCS